METVIALLVVGAILLVLETILPGMIAGIIGVICIVAGVIQSYVTFGPTIGTYVLAGTFFLFIVGTMLWLKFFPNSRAGRLFASKRAVGDIHTERPELLDQTGSALTPLRPSGTALINGHRVDVVTEGAMIERHTPIKVGSSRVDLQACKLEYSIVSPK